MTTATQSVKPEEKQPEKPVKKASEPPPVPELVTFATDMVAAARVIDDYAKIGPAQSLNLLGSLMHQAHYEKV